MQTGAAARSAGGAGGRAQRAEVVEVDDPDEEPPDDGLEEDVCDDSFAVDVDDEEVDGSLDVDFDSPSPEDVDSLDDPLRLLDGRLSFL